VGPTGRESLVFRTRYVRGPGPCSKRPLTCNLAHAPHESLATTPSPAVTTEARTDPDDATGVMTAAGATPPAPAEFVKAMSLTDATMLAVGTMIGSGIFIVSAGIARAVGSPAGLLAAWAVTGIMTILGALAYGELAAMYPQAGGQYVFLRQAFGPLPGFLYGWTLLTVIQTGTIAAVAVAFGRFLGVLVPAISPERFASLPHGDVCMAALGCPAAAAAIQVGLSPQRVIALGVIWTLTTVNMRGVRGGAMIQTSLTLAKSAAVVALVALALTIGRNQTAIGANFSATGFWGQTPVASPLLLTFCVALVGSLFATDSWNNVTFAAAEIRNPQRNLPRALVLGTGLVTLLYVLINLAYLNVLPLAGAADGATVLARGIQQATQDRVATAVAEQILGSAGAAVMAAAILVSTFGSDNGLILSGARVYYAMARDGLFFRAAGRLNDRQVPGWALVAQALWVSVLCVSGTYSQLIEYVVFAALVFYAVTTMGLFTLRRTQPHVLRPYRAWGYPVLPALYVTLTTGVALALLVVPSTRTQALVGLMLVLVGVPVYGVWRMLED
jgi:basic amino acid/polyamine antiporter, APA family